MDLIFFVSPAGDGDQMVFFGLLLEGFFYGLYSGLFTMYLQHQTLNKDTNRRQNVIFFSVCALHVLSTAAFACNIAFRTHDFQFPIFLIQTTLFGCGDFIAQFILIYRCWIVWGCNIRVVIVPSILAFAFLATWLVGGNSAYTFNSGELVDAEWGYLMTMLGLALSLTVNALVTGLIVFRIFKVFREVKATSDDQVLGTTSGSKLRRIIFILIESGMALFSVQLVRLVITFMTVQPDADNAYFVIVGIHEMFNGLTPTIILVRTSIGLSFHDEKSMEEAAIESLCFASGHPIPEIGSITGVVGQNNREDDIDVQRSNDIDIVER